MNITSFGFPHSEISGSQPECGSPKLFAAYHVLHRLSHVEEGYPLYYDAANEAGLCMAGLNFAGFAQYGASEKGKDNVACFEFIPWVLGQCSSVKDVRKLLPQLQLTGIPFSKKLPTAQLHWIPEGLTLPRIIAGNYRDCCQNRSN